MNLENIFQLNFLYGMEKSRLPTNGSCLTLTISLQNSILQTKDRI